MSFDPNEWTTESSKVQKQTHVTFNNPDHPDNEVDNEEEREKKKRRFDAAMNVRRSHNIEAIAGDFLIAIDEDKVEEFLQAYLE